MVLYFGYDVPSERRGGQLTLASKDDVGMMVWDQDRVEPGVFW